LPGGARGFARVRLCDEQLEPDAGEDLVGFQRGGVFPRLAVEVDREQVLANAKVVGQAALHLRPGGRDRAGQLVAHRVRPHDEHEPAAGGEFLRAQPGCALHDGLHPLPHLLIQVKLRSLRLGLGLGLRFGPRLRLWGCGV